MAPPLDDFSSMTSARDVRSFLEISLANVGTPPKIGKNGTSDLLQPNKMIFSGNAFYASYFVYLFPIALAF